MSTLVGQVKDDDLQSESTEPSAPEAPGALIEHEAPAATAPASAPPEATSTPAAPAAKTAKNKVSFYTHPDDADRARGAYLHTQIQTGHRSLSEFIDSAVMDKVKHLEERYNDGKPFPSVTPGSMAQGRPMGS
ncbi:ParB family protein [Clavibacter michiganensis]|uniref:ParB family protein n=1 Tax=Clavibacter michiganensis TaxID=28447 RepID=UPI00345C4A78